jgi:HEAT repeat protein
MNRIGEWLKVRPGEGRIVGLLTGLMALTSMGGSIGGTGIEALFYARFGVNFLPYMYMVLGPTVLVTSLAITGLLGRVQREKLFTFLPILLALILIAERFVVALNIALFYAVMWVLMNVMGMLQGLLTWGLAGAVTDTRQAKRLFPLFGAGGILGAVAGGFGTSPLVRLIGSENLLLIWAGALLIAFGFGRALISRQAGQPAGAARRARRTQRSGLIAEMQQGFRFVQKSSLMRWMALGTILFSILLFSVAFPFSKAATAQFKDADTLAGFLGLFNGVSTAVALLVSLLLANRLFARFGIMSMILVLPLIYLAGFSALSVTAPFFMIVAFRFVQAVWLSGVSGTAYQAVFNVVPAERRDQTRAFFNGVPEQAGTVIAGLVLVIGDRLLTSQQLYLIGLAAALAALVVIGFARRAYGSALVDLLKVGQPHVFAGGDEPFGGFQRDAAAVAAVVAGMSSDDPSLRRVSVEILSDLPVSEAAQPLIDALYDSDAQVRAAALRGLAQSGATRALLDIAARLDDPEPEVRMQAIIALQKLAADPRGLAALVERHLADPYPPVRARAAMALLQADPGSQAAAISAMVSADDPWARASAVQALGDFGRAETFDLAASALQDADASVRQAAVMALAGIDPSRAVPLCVAALSNDDPAMQVAVVSALERIGPPALQAVLSALADPALESGALLALERLPAGQAAGAIRAYARQAAERALHTHALWEQSRSAEGDDRGQLLADSLRAKSVEQAVHALRAAGLLGDRESLAVAIQNLQSPDQGFQANALETLESVGDPHIVRPLLVLWEPGHAAQARPAGWLDSLLADSDAWIRACAVLVAAGIDGSQHAATLKRLAKADLAPIVREAASAAGRGKAGLSLMERILFLRKASLFSQFTPVDLEHVAALASERSYAGGEVITRQGEPGDEMFVIVSGEVRVMSAGAGGKSQEVARRATNDVVGEMAIISQEPRIATLIASGAVRLLVVGRLAFEGILKDRPETSLMMMRVLCERIRQAPPKIEAAR